MIKYIGLLFICCLGFQHVGNAQQSYIYKQPLQLQDGWKTKSIHSVEVDTSRIYQFFSQAYQGPNKLHSVLLVQDEKLIIEEYLNGAAASQPHDLRSVTKSIRSILLGIAIDKGIIEYIDDPISKYLKDPVPTKNLDQRKDQITIRHLITMSTGLDCNDWDPSSKGQEDKVYRKKDWIQYTLNLPMIHEPGTVSNYCSMGTVLLAEVISRASGMTLQQFAKVHLFDPLGIENVRWGHTSHKEVIASAKRLYMTSRDLAKIGQLVLNKGRWNGVQVVSEAWIVEATSPKTKITEVDYGFLWWHIPFRRNEATLAAQVATGNGGQYIIILPALNMVAVFTGGAYNSQDDKLPFAIVQNVFIPTFK